MASRQASMEPAVNTQTKVAIAAETISGGGLLHYLVSLDDALRTYAPDNYFVVSPAPSGHTASPAPSLKGSLRGALSAIRPLRNAVMWMRKKTKTEPLAWADLGKWTSYWTTLPDDVVCLLPHVVFHDEGRLDPYYAAIASHKLVWVIQDLHAYHFPDQWRPIDLDVMHRRFHQLASRAGAVIVHNKYTAEDVVEKLSIPSERISVVHLPAIFSEAAYPAPRSFDLQVLAKFGDTTPYALWASSSTSSHKNHENLLRAWRILIDRGQAIRLICTGSTRPRWEQISRLIRDLGLDMPVRFTGEVSDLDMAILLRNAKIAVCPTLFEGAGMGPASEAIIAGVPAAMSNIAPLMEQFDWRTDLCSFFDPRNPEAIADAVGEILHDYEKSRLRAQRAAKEFLAMRSWKSGAEGYWNAVESVAIGSGT